LKITVAIRTDGSTVLGNGHIIRMLGLARELGNRSIDLVFIIKSDDFWIKSIQENYRVVALDEKEDIDYLCNILKENEISHFVYDTRNDLEKAEIEYISKKSKTKTIVIDTPEDTRLAADCVLYPPIQQVKEWSWKDFKGKLFSGWEYVLLRNEFLNKRPLAVITHKVLLSFGSTDPFFLTEKFLKSIVKCGEWYKSYEFILVVGPQFDRLSVIEETTEFKALNIKVYQSPTDIAQIYSLVDFAFISFGVTAYELACLKIPMLYISISEDHEKSAKIFETIGIGTHLGRPDTFTNDFKNKTEAFVNNLNSVSLQYQKNNFGTGICNWDKIIKAIIE